MQQSSNPCPRRRALANLPIVLMKAVKRTTPDVEVAATAVKSSAALGPLMFTLLSRYSISPAGGLSVCMFLADSKQRY